MGKFLNEIYPKLSSPRRDEGFLTRLRIGSARHDLAIGPAVIVLCTVDVRSGTGGAGIPNDASIILFSNTRPNKKRGFRRAFRLIGHRDPQTYALLYCSVFKEPTLPPSPFRTGSTTAPQGQGVRVNESYTIKYQQMKSRF